MQKDLLMIRELKLSDEKSFYQAMLNFGISDPEFCFAFRTDEREDFSGYLSLLEDNKVGKDLKGFVPNSYFVAILNNEIVGRVSVRHTLNPALLLDGGHIGYCVLSEYRKKGIGKALLHYGLKVCKIFGIEEALVTVAEENTASLKVVRSIRQFRSEQKMLPDSGVVMNYFWIPTSDV